jgi:hypothetical protein
VGSNRDPFADKKGLRDARTPISAAIGILTLGIALALSSMTMASATAYRGTKTHKGAKHPKAGAVSATCPSSAEITAMAGSAYPAPTVSKSSGTVLCNYSDPTSGANLVIEFTSVSGASASASALKIAADSQANAEKTTAVAVSGLGNAAYSFTLNDASTNSSGVATTSLEILDGSKFIDITAEATVAQVDAIARYVLAH